MSRSENPETGEDSGAAVGLVDLHSHLVPGVDDGAPSIEDALEGIQRMIDAGIRRIVTTPHFDGSLTRSPEAMQSVLARMDEGWRLIHRAVEERFPDLVFRRGHEVMLDTPDVDFSDARLRLADTSFVLVEWPRLHVPPETPHVVSRIRFGGIKPVIAHPERYSGVDRQLTIIGEWRRSGAYLQVSYGSFVGRYGERARRTAFRLLERGWIDYLSTDFHGRPHLDLYVNEARDLLEKVGAGEAFELMASTNPHRLLRDEEPLSIEGVKVEDGFMERVRSAFSSRPSGGGSG